MRRVIQFAVHSISINIGKYINENQESVTIDHCIFEREKKKMERTNVILISIHIQYIWVFEQSISFEMDDNNSYLYINVCHIRRETVRTMSSFNDYVSVHNIKLKSRTKKTLKRLKKTRHTWNCDERMIWWAANGEQWTSMRTEKRFW